MGSKHSKTGATLTPEQQKRERDDTEHKEYVKKVLGRNDASQELQAALIDCAENKKNLREAQSNNDFLKAELTAARAATVAANSSHQYALEMNRTVMVSSAIMLCAAFFLLFGVMISSKRTGINGYITHSTAANIQSIVDTSEVVVVTKDRFSEIMGGRFSEASAAFTATNAWEQLLRSRTKVTYFQLLAILQQELLPRLTLPLIAACLSITLLLIAAVGYVAPRWSTMSSRGRLECTVSSMVLFLCSGLYLSSIDDSIDIPAGVLLTTGVLLAPAVVVTGFQTAHAHMPAAIANHTTGWQLIMSSFVVMALSLVLLHTVSFAPLVPLLVCAFTVVTVFVTILLMGQHVRQLQPPGGSSTIVIEVVLWLLSLAAWSHSCSIAEFIQPSRHNTLYPLVTDVGSWLDWTLMLSSFAWSVLLYIQLVYCVTLPDALYCAVSRLNVLQCGPTLSFLYILLYLNVSAEETSTRAATIAMFAHILWGTYFAGESMFLTVVTHKVNGFGFSEQAFLLNGILLWISFTRNYRVLMVYSVVNIAAYVLLKFGVAAAALVAALVLAVGLHSR